MLFLSVQDIRTIFLRVHSQIELLVYKLSALGRDIIEVSRNRIADAVYSNNRICSVCAAAQDDVDTLAHIEAYQPACKIVKAVVAVIVAYKACRGPIGISFARIIQYAVSGRNNLAGAKIIVSLKGEAYKAAVVKDAKNVSGSAHFAHDNRFAVNQFGIQYP